MESLIQLKFPPIHKLVEKNQGSLEDDDPKQGVIIKENHAIVVGFHYVVLVDLEQYFTVKEKKNTMEDVENLHNILNFMNNRLYSVSYWDELCNNGTMSIKDKKLHIEGSVRKDLYTETKEFNFKEVQEHVGKIVDMESIALNRVGLHSRALYQILKAFGTSVQKDSIALEFVGVSSGCKFTFENNPWIFGIIDQDAIFQSNQFLWEDFNSFYSGLRIDG